MAKQNSSGTKEKLLIAASKVFSEKGFRDATVLEICNHAKANIASVNYYFGSKEDLYQEAWRYSFAESIRKHPLDGGVRKEDSAKERLSGQIKALIKRIGDENSRDFLIAQKEFTNPSGLLEEVMKSEMAPIREQTLSLVGELLGPNTPEQQVVFCEMCIISMCIHPIMIQRNLQKSKHIGPFPTIDNLEAFADHVIQFALAGISSIKNI